MMKTIILPDGSYGTETIIMDDPAKAKFQQTHSHEDNLPLRKALIHAEDDYIGSCLAITLTKLVIKTKKNLKSVFNQMAIDTILIICSLLKAQNAKKIDQDSKSRMQLCLKILTNQGSHHSLSQIEKVLVD